jgi:hypothetical protein
MVTIPTTTSETSSIRNRCDIAGIAGFMLLYSREGITYIASATREPRPVDYPTPAGFVNGGVYWRHRPVFIPNDLGDAVLAELDAKECFVGFDSRDRAWGYFRSSADACIWLQQQGCTPPFHVERFGSPVGNESGNHG